MRGCLLLLPLLACGYQAFNFLSTVVTYGPRLNDAVAVIYKVSYQNTCVALNWTCQSGDCAPVTLIVSYNLDTQCHLEGHSSYRNVTQKSQSVLRLDGLQWINVTNNVTEVLAVTRVNTWTRSDTGRANASPRANVLPVVRVPANCRRNMTLPTFDPDGDVVTCRYRNATSVLKLWPDCNMVFSPDSGIVEGAYAVQLIMEDFPGQNITLSNGEGNQTLLTSQDAIGQIPVQFVLMVDPPVVSCVEGEHLPVFQDPTPANGDHLFTSVNETLGIATNFSVQKSLGLKVVFRGPALMNVMISDGIVFLVWTPTERDLSLSQAVCFAIESVDEGLITRQSEMRCVIVSVSPVTARLQSAFPLSSDDIRALILGQLKRELVARGMPSDITLRLASYSQKTQATTPSGGGLT